jgi:hypothetical protein
MVINWSEVEDESDELKKIMAKRLKLGQDQSNVNQLINIEGALDNVPKRDQEKTKELKKREKERQENRKDYVTEYKRFCGQVREKRKRDAEAKAAAAPPPPARGGRGGRGRGAGPGRGRGQGGKGCDVDPSPA